MIVSKRHMAYKKCEFNTDCGESCKTCLICGAPKGQYGVECEDCNACRDQILSAYSDLIGRSIHPYKII